jgi:hypothetical protein
MRIVILTPQTDQSQIKKDFNPLIHFIESKNHKADVVTITPKKTISNADEQDFSVSISNEIKNADAIILASGLNGIELGICISLCMQHRKTTLVLYERTKPESILLSATNMITFVKYNDKAMEEMESILKPFFTDIKKQRLLYRFNLMLSREMNIFLGQRSRENGVSKADYVRQLIVRDIGSIEE